MAPADVVSARKDSKVIVREICLVHPQQTLKRRTMFLTNIDQFHGFFCRDLYFYKDHPGLEQVAAQIKSSVTKILVSYDCHAGRLEFNPDNNKLQVDCNSAGALFATATCALCISDVTNEELDDFFLSPAEAKSLNELPLMTVQVTHMLSDGGVAIALLQQHTLVDATSGMSFMFNLASINRGEGLFLPPNTDRTSLKARHPPQVKFQHPGLAKLVDKSSRFTVSTDTILNAEKSRRNSERKERKIYHFGIKKLNKLKRIATADGSVLSCSSFEALAAFIWRAHAQSLPNKKPNDLLKVRFVMNVRNVLQPPLGLEFCGNGVLGAVAEMTLDELSKLPLSQIVLRIQEARKRMTDEFVRSTIDYLELHPDHWFNCETQINAWPKLMAKAVEVDFGWGKPARTEFPLDHRNRTLVFFPSDGKGNEDGFYISVGMDPAPLAIFEKNVALP